MKDEKNLLEIKKDKLIQQMPNIASSGVNQEYLQIYSEWETKNINIKN